MNKCNKKRLEIKLESVDPTGVTVKSKSFGMKVTDDKECMRVERLILHVGDCLYRIDNNGYIIERLVPHENSTPKHTLPLVESFEIKQEKTPENTTPPPPPPPADRVLKEGKTPKPPKKK